MSIQTLAPEQFPQHIAIIMDGNGRWAQSQNKNRLLGHKAGVETVRRIVRHSGKLKHVKYLTLYTFSTENWRRPRTEVKGLMQLLAFHLEKEIQELHENNVRLEVIGNVTELSLTIQKKIEAARQKTQNNQGLTLILALNYGGRKELVNAFQTIAQRIEQGQLHANEIDENVIASHLYTHTFPDPDLVIRTANELRLSNYLLWQTAYAELWFTPKTWPEFQPEDLDQAILDYSQRKRKFGAVPQNNA